MHSFELPGPKDPQELYRSGHLKIETIEPEVMATMVAEVLAPPRPGIYMEIGPASHPYCVNSTRQFSEQVHYLGIDGGHSEYYPNSLGPLLGHAEYGTGLASTHMNAAVQKLSDYPNTTVIWGDAQQLPLPDHHKNNTLPIREVFMRDVFLDAGVHPDSIHKIMQEQARVMANDGIMIVRETTFTGYHSGNGEINGRFLHLVAALHDAGFTRRCMVFDDVEGFDELIAQFPGSDDNKFMPNGYYLICGRGAAEEIEAPAENATTSFLQTVRQKLGRFVSGVRNP